MSRRPLALFEGYGIELEYMLVGAEGLNVLPATDRVIEAVAGKIVSEIELGELAWSNELVLHVIELKTNGPAPGLEGLAAFFQRDVQRINALLGDMDARLMPTAMHPWMDPHTETRLWPHEYSPVYEAYNRIFNCQGHGWSNLQSMHINLPFADDDDFARLHAGIRLILPILPALAASSPIVEGQPTGILDNRLEAYRNNSRRIPSLTGQVIPEPVFSHADYEREILQRLYRDIAPLDPEGVLQFEFLNSRGAIARFDRHAIEIRVLDLQECPRADLGVAALITAVLKEFAGETWTSRKRQMEWPVEPLAGLFRRAIVDVEAAVIDDADYLAMFGYRGSTPCTMGELWRDLAARVMPAGNEWEGALKVILEQGTLARRILRAAGSRPDRARLERIYAGLCDCLQNGSMFEA